jgi:hypothetical protein
MVLLPLLVLCVAISPALMVLPALAAAVTSADTSVGIAFLPTMLVWANSTAGILGMAVGLWLFRDWLRAYVKTRGLEDDATVRGYILPALDLVVNAVVGRLGLPLVLASVGPEANPTALAARSAAVDEEVRYLSSKVNGGLAQLSLSGVDARDMVVKRLEAIGGQVAKAASGIGP